MNARAEYFLGQLSMRLKLAQVAYSSYMGNGRPFMYAAVLYEHNRAIRDLALANGHLLSESLQADLRRLVFHIDVWAFLWRQTQERTHPKPSDEFVFQNPVQFPRESVERILNAVRPGQDET